jgi:hypothetical protein
VYSVWQRHDLENTKKRLEALEARSRKMAEKESHGAFDRACPAYRVAQDTLWER